MENEKFLMEIAPKLSPLQGLRPKLKNLSGGLNLSRGLNMVGST